VKARHSTRPGDGSSHLLPLKSILILLIIVHFSGITFALFHRVSHKTLYVVLVSILAVCPGHRSLADFMTGVLMVLDDEKSFIVPTDAFNNIKPSIIK
jgi:hypothetical protein